MRHIPELLIAFIFCFFLIAGFVFYTSLIPGDSTLQSPSNNLLKYFYPPQSKAQFWMPSIKQAQIQAEKPELFAKAALSYDLSTDTMVISKNIDENFP